jgi:alcohol dehydrogenase class IV
MVHEILMPDRIVYGQGAYAEVGKQTARFGKKALIVIDPVMERIGHVGTESVEI